MRLRRCSIPDLPAIRHAIFLSGPVGVGKTTLGRALAARLDAVFIDSDDLGDPTKPWIAEVLTASQKLVGAVEDAWRRSRVVVVARPLRARDWHMLRRRLTAPDAAIRCVTLTAGLDAILAPGRSRAFDPAERARIAEMIAQGYCRSPFSDLVVVDTGGEDFAATLARLTAGCRGLLAGDAAE